MNALLQMAKKAGTLEMMKEYVNRRQFESAADVKTAMK